MFMFDVKYQGTSVPKLQDPCRLSCHQATGKSLVPQLINNPAVFGNISINIMYYLRIIFTNYE